MVLRSPLNPDLYSIPENTYINIQPLLPPIQSRLRQSTPKTMQYLTITLLALTGALAAPLANKAPAIAASNSATCVGYTNTESLMFDYSKAYFQVNIGRPFLGGGRCDDLKSKIETKFNIDGKLSCKGTDNDRNTVLKFKSSLKKDNLKMVNAGLKAAYPEIKFSCPTDIRS